MRRHGGSRTLRRFWFVATDGYGIGVTAFDATEAQAMAMSALDLLPPGASLTGEMVEDVDLATLDAAHVRGEMGSPVMRGVWFPRS